MLFFVVAGISLLLPAFAAAEDVSCYYCGMKKSRFGHSWMIITYNDGTRGEFCSLHCAAIDMVLHMEKTPLTVLVGDYFTKKLIDADKSHWVIGGSKPGVMTTRAKWAFETEEAAQTYMKEFGSEPATFRTAARAAFEDMYEDMMMIQEKRENLRMRKMNENK